MTGIIKVDDLKDAGGNSIISSNGSGTFTYTFNAGSIARAALAADIIDGTKLADDAINSEHYTDGSIDTAHIADDQVTLAKMAGLARGKIIYGDSSGNPAALAVGSNNQVLKSDGTDISWGTDSSGTITALNNATANELVTVGSTTTELDSETNLIYDGTRLGAGADGANADLGTGIHIKAGDSGASVDTSFDELIIERGGNCGINILTATNAIGAIMVGDSGSPTRGGFKYSNASDEILLTTGGDNTGLAISAEGYVTKPLQPSFMTNQTGALTVANGHTLFSTNTTERWDTNSDLSGSTFTAPITGKYLLVMNVLYESVGSDAIFEDSIETSNRRYACWRNTRAYSSDSTYLYQGMSVIADMDGNDTAYCKHNGGGTFAVHSSNAAWCYFQGYLIG